MFLDGMKRVSSSWCSTKMSFLNPLLQNPLLQNPPSRAPARRGGLSVTGTHSLQSTVIPARTTIFGVVPVVLRSVTSRPFIRSLGETFTIHGEREWGASHRVKNS